MRLMTLVLGIGGIVLLASCAPPEAPPPTVAEVLAAGNYSLVDLSHSYYEGMPEFQAPPHLGQGVPFKLNEISRWDEPGMNTWYWNWYQVTEHSGTHVDAPNHWFPGKDKEAVEEIPLERLVAPAVVVDVKSKAAADSDYMVSVDDLKAWEQANGEIPPGAVIIMNSGWSDKYSDPMAFLGLNDAGELHFPGFSPEAHSVAVGEPQHQRGGVRFLVHRRARRFSQHRSIQSSAYRDARGREVPDRADRERGCPSRCRCMGGGGPDEDPGRIWVGRPYFRDRTVAS